MYTLIGTAKINDIDPQAWLADVLARIANTPITRLDDLLPWNWAANMSTSRQRSPGLRRRVTYHGKVAELIPPQMGMSDPHAICATAPGAWNPAQPSGPVW